MTRHAARARHASTARRAALPVALLCLGLTAACSPSTGPSETAESGSSDTGKTLSLTNCGQKVSYPAPVNRLFVNDGGMIAIGLAAGARPQTVGVSSLARDKAVLEQKFGKQQVDGLNEVNDESPTLENILPTQPQVVYAGWNYGFSESKNLTPDALADHGIGTYQLTEACRQSPGQKSRGVTDPWTALDTDLKNIGTLTGHPDQGKAAAADVSTRLAALRAAPQAAKKPTVFLFDSGQDTVFTSGSFGGPQGVIDAAGARNATEDVRDTWTAVSWERLTTADPDVIVFVDYPGQTVEQKIAALKANPASKDLTAVKGNHFINMPYAMWVSSPLNIDAAETLRHSLEAHGLQPTSEITPQLNVAALGLGGQDWLAR